MAYKTVWNPAYGMYVRKKSGGRRRRRGLSGIGAFPTVTSLKASFDSVKDVLLFGSLAAGGAFVTEQVWNMVGKSLKITDPTQKALAEIATGIGLGMIIARFTKKTQLGAAFAVGAVVKGALDLVSHYISPVSGFGIYDVTNPGAFEPARTRPFNAIPQVTGPGFRAQTDMPAFMAYPTPNEFSSVY